MDPDHCRSKCQSFIEISHFILPERGVFATSTTRPCWNISHMISIKLLHFVGHLSSFLLAFSYLLQLCEWPRLSLEGVLAACDLSKLLAMLCEENVYYFKASLSSFSPMLLYAYSSDALQSHLEFNSSHCRTVVSVLISTPTWFHCAWAAFATTTSQPSFQITWSPDVNTCSSSIFLLWSSSFVFPVKCKTTYYR